MRVPVPFESVSKKVTADGSSYIDDTMFKRLCSDWREFGRVS